MIGLQKSNVKKENEKKENEKKECGVCCNEKTILVKCPYCPYEACAGCYERVILDSINKPACMSCKKQFSDDFVASSFTKVFCTKRLKVHRENILLDLEMARMPATQPHAEYLKKREQMKEEIDFLAEQIKEMTIRRRELLAEYRWGDAGNNDQEEKVEKSTYVGACPKNDCRGFLSTKHICGMCGVKACADCREVDTDDHKCNQDTVQSINEMKKTCKNCPNCMTAIFKTEGCFAKNQPILMYDGTVKMSQEIAVGDILTGDDGEKRIVQNLMRGQDNMYTIFQNNGETYTVNSQHKLVLKYTGDRSISWNESLKFWKVSWFCRETLSNKTKNFNISSTISKDEAYLLARTFVDTLIFDEEIEIKVDDYMKLNIASKKKLFGFKSSNGVNYPFKHVDFDPYLLGLWLGDGTHTHPVIASNDPEIQHYITKWCDQNDAELVHEEGVKFRIRRRGLTNFKDSRKDAVGSGNCKACVKNGKYFEICKKKDILPLSEPNILKTNPFFDQLKIYNLVGNKHIPLEYLNNDRDTRLKLLAGLIDTDGYVSNNGKRATIIQTSPLLSNQIITLGRSCGFVVNVRVVERKNEIIFKSQAKDYKNQYHITISGQFLYQIPTILPRKKCVSSIPNKDHYRTSIIVKPINKDTFYGWSVDQNKRFLSPDHTVLRNCDQMWCTKCNVAFSWKSGKVEKGVVHNPHYFEWLNRTGGVAPRNPHAERCGGMPEARFLSDKRLRVMIQLPDNRFGKTYRGQLASQFVTDSYREVQHIRNVVLPVMPTVLDNQTNIDLRVDYLNGKITKDEMKVKLQRREKDRAKKLEYRDVLDMYCTVLQDMFYRLFETWNVSEFVEEETRLQEHSNKAITSLNKRYNSKLHILR